MLWRRVLHSGVQHKASEARLQQGYGWKELQCKRLSLTSSTIAVFRIAMKYQFEVNVVIPGVIQVTAGTGQRQEKLPVSLQVPPLYPFLTTERGCVKYKWTPLHEDG